MAAPQNNDRIVNPEDIKPEDVNEPVDSDPDVEVADEASAALPIAIQIERRPAPPVLQIR